MLGVIGPLYRFEIMELSPWGPTHSKDLLPQAPNQTKVTPRQEG